MAHCDEYVELISAALDGALSPEEQAKLEVHLAQCPDCKALYEDLARIHQDLLDLPAAEVPADLADRIMEAVAAEAAQSKVVPLPQPKKSAFRWQRWAVTAAAAAVVLLSARTMQDRKLAGESLIAPAQALPSPSVSAESGLRTYSDRSITLESDSPDTDSAELTDNNVSIQTQNAEIAQASESPTPEIIPAQATPTPYVTPAPEAPAIPEETPASSGAVTPRMAISQKTSPPIPESTSTPATGEGSNEVQPGDLAVPNTFTAQALPSEEVPLLPEPTDETAVPNDMLLTSVGNDLISVDGESEETVSLTPKEALALAAELCPTLEGATLVDTEKRLALETPFTPVGSDPTPNAQQVSIQLEYWGITPNKSYHEFCLYSAFIDSPGDEERPSILNFLAVPIGGGEVLVQRQEVEGDPHDEDVWSTYLAGVDAYYEATGYLEPSQGGEDPLPSSESPQP